MRDAKTYVKTCITALISLLALSALFNRVVDPFWYYRDISVEGFNAIKTQFSKYERHIKPIILQEAKPDAVIFSSSVFEGGLNPAHPAFTRNGNYRGYNFGMMAAWWERTFCNIVYALDTIDPKEVIIGINPGPLPTIDCNEQLRTMGNLRQATVLFSFDALKASYKTIIQQHKKPTHTLDGMLFYDNYEGEKYGADKIEEIFDFYFSKQAQKNKGKTCRAPEYFEIPAWIVPNAREDLSGLNYLLKRLVDRKVQVKLIVYPVHALWMELAMCDGVLDRWHSLYRMANVVAEANQGVDAVELWDFQGFSGFLVEKIRNNQVKYWQDYGHFNSKLGDVILDTVYHRKQTQAGAEGDAFGVLLTPESVPDRFHRFFYNRREFLKNNPWFIQYLARYKTH